MGDFSFVSYQGDEFDFQMQEGYMLKVERVKFEHASKYIYWKNEVIGSV